MIAAIWGRRYVEMFARVSLPSYLASGNIPSLMERVDLEVAIMTTRESVDLFEREPTFAALRQHCTVSFILIDDLVTDGHYGVTLTLAFARGVRLAGERQTDSWFIFMNSDFVLADGSLGTLADHMARNEARCVLAPSLRVQAEPAVPRLLEAFDPRTSVLSMGRRDMVAMAFEMLHPTVVGKTVTQDLLAARTYNQIFWQVDDATLLARYHLIFMLAIRPERPMPPVTSYCDYGFVPDLAPSGPWVVLDDSDDCFIMELQQTAQERELLFAGAHDPTAIANGLAAWTTREHRAVGERDIVFHARDLPAGLAPQKAALGKFMGRIEALLKGRPPIGYANHPYWSPAVRMWGLSRAEQAGMGRPAGGGAEGGAPEGLPPELALEGGRCPSKGGGVASVYARILQGVRRRRGRGMRVALWHNQWPDIRLIDRELNEIARDRAARTLVVDGGDGTLAAECGRRLDAAMATVEGLGDPPVTRASPFDAVVIRLPWDGLDEIRALVAKAQPLLAPGGTLTLWIHHPGAAVDPANHTDQIPLLVEGVLPRDWLGWTISVRLVGGRVRRFLRRLELSCLRALWPGRWREVPAALLSAVVLPFLAAAMAGANLREGARSDSARPAFCTSILVTMRRRDGEASRAKPMPGE